jgi:hypothetical protein
MVVLYLTATRRRDPRSRIAPGGSAFGARQAAGFAIIDIGGFAPNTPE